MRNLFINMLTGKRKQLILSIRFVEAFKVSKLSFAFALKTGVINERIVTCPVYSFRRKTPTVTTNRRVLE